MKNFKRITLSPVLSETDIKRAAAISGSEKYYIKKGETLHGILFKLDMSLKELLYLNPGIDALNLSEGEINIFKK